MKKKLLTAALLFISLVSMAQSRLIDFNQYTSPANNDLTNKFSYTGFYQIPGSGITGGAVYVPDKPGMMQYKTYLDSTQNSTPIEVSIFFKYNSDSLTSNANALVISLNPVTVPGLPDTASGLKFFFRPVGTSPEFGSRQATSGASSIPTASSSQLINDHWYKMSQSMRLVQMSGFDYVLCDGVLADCGLYGLSAPFTVNDNVCTLQVTGTFAKSPQYALQVRAAYNCGVRYLDDLKITTPQFLSVSPVSELSGANIYPTEADQVLHVCLQDYNKCPDAGFSLTAVNGKCVLTKRIQSTSEQISLQGVPAGVYMARITSCGKHLTRKIIRR